MAERDEAPQPERLAALLKALDSRAFQALDLRVLRGLSTDQAATFFQISTEAFRIMLLRAALALEALARGERAPVRPDELDQRQATTLDAELEGPSRASAPSEVQLLQALAAQRNAVQQSLDRLAREEAESPRQRRADLSRRIGLVVLIGLALYLYLRGM
jgi:hypothetical protein